VSALWRTRPLAMVFLPVRFAPPNSSTRATGAKTIRALLVPTSSTICASPRIEAVASKSDSTLAQVALAWLLSKGYDIAPIPGTKRVARLEENLAADDLELTADQINALDHLTLPAGDRHEEGDMRLPGR